MKKALTLTIIGGLASTLVSNAQVVVRISGSTAFRSVVFSAVTNAFDAGSLSNNPSYTFSGASGTWAAQGTISNTFPGQTVIIEAAYDGSVRGLGDFLTPRSFPTMNSNVTETTTPDFTFTDVDKSSTIFKNVPTVEWPVAVQPFVWVKSAPATTITNITGHQIRNLLNSGSGHFGAYAFTGNSNDTYEVYVTGRNRDSGTRVLGDADAYASDATPVFWGYEAGSTNFQQMYVNRNGATYGIGYDSGGSEAGAFLSNATPALVAYLGIGDARTAIGGSGTHGSILTYDGLFPGTNITASSIDAATDFSLVANGAYSYWAYENLELANVHNNTNDNVYKYAVLLTNKLDSTLATVTPKNAMRLSELRVTRTSVGGVIVP